MEQSWVHLVSWGHLCALAVYDTSSWDFKKRKWVTLPTILFIIDNGENVRILIMYILPPLYSSTCSTTVQQCRSLCNGWCKCPTSNNCNSYKNVASCKNTVQFRLSSLWNSMDHSISILEELMQCVNTLSDMNSKVYVSWCKMNHTNCHSRPKVDLVKIEIAKGFFVWLINQ